MKNILIVCTNSDAAGAPNHVYIIVSGLMNVFNFSVVFGEEGVTADRLRSLGVKVHIINSLRSAISINKDLLAVSELNKIVEDYNPDLIHLHSAKAGMLGRFVAKKNNMPVIYTVHGWGWRGFGPIKAFLVYFIEKFLYLYVKRVRFIYVSQSVEAEAYNVLGISKSSGFVIYNGVPELPIQTISKNSEKLTICMVARACNAKDHKTLIRSFEKLDLDSELILCGSGTDSIEFKKEAEEWAPTKNQFISFLGERKDIPEILKRVDVFTLISKFEALPLSIIEAMSAGKAIIATDVGGVRELIDHGVSGLVVPPENIDDLIDAFKFFSNKNNRSSLGNCARDRYLNQFTGKAMLINIENEYNFLLS